MRKKYRFHGLRHPRTTQERRAASVEPKLVRGKRHASNLPNVYDDIWVNVSFSWKEMRKHQYRGKKRKHHKVFIPDPHWGNWLFNLYDSFIQKNCYFTINRKNGGYNIEWWE